jgi:hypothetical protein
MILTIHTANAWFNKKPILSIKKVFRTLDTNLSTIIGRLLILPKFDALNVIYYPIKQYILDNTDYKKKVFTLPFELFDESIDIKSLRKDNKIKFVVPGQIEEHRREYNDVLDVFEKLFRYYNENIVLYLLGYPVGIYGSKIIKRCKKLEKNGYNIKYFENFVPENDYTGIMKDVDLIISPIRIKSRGAGVITEIYGKTKGTAVVYEAIQYVKPLVLPYEFNNIKELNSSTLKYKDNDDLEKTLINLIENRDKIEKMKKEALNNSKEFTIDVFQEYFINEIVNKIDEL